MGSVFVQKMRMLRIYVVIIPVCDQKIKKLLFNGIFDHFGSYKKTRKSNFGYHYFCRSHFQLNPDFPLNGDFHLTIIAILGTIRKFNKIPKCDFIHPIKFHF